MTGHHFEVFKEDGLWFWHLHVGNSPYGAIVGSLQGYKSMAAAKRSIRSARDAAANANEEIAERPSN